MDGRDLRPGPGACRVPAQASSAVEKHQAPVDRLDLALTLTGAKQLRGVASWAVAIALGAAGLALRFRFATWLDQAPFLVFFPPVAICAVVCGWRQASALLVAGAAASAAFLLRLHGPAALSYTTIGFRLAGFIFTGCLFISAFASMQSAVRRLQSAVRLQENLFRDLQHRVANNMQVAAAVLAQTRRAMTDEAARNLVQRAEQRISAMGDLHRRLYDPRGYQGGLAPLLRDTLGDLFRDVHVDVRLDIDPGPLTTDQLTLIGLLVVEAATNAAKHVFAAGRGTTFSVCLAPLVGAKLRLAITDDGPGIGPLPEGSNRLGMAIMRSLAQQLGGALEVVDGPGTTLRVDFSKEGLIF